MSQDSNCADFDEVNYAVITFDESSAVEAIPWKWLNACKTKCWWPPKNKTKHISNLIKLGTEPNPDSWNSFDITVIQKYSDYNSAKKKVDRIVKEVSSTSGDECLGRGQRKIKQVYGSEPFIPIIPIPYGNKNSNIPLLLSSTDSNIEATAETVTNIQLENVDLDCGTLTPISAVSTNDDNVIYEYHDSPPVQMLTLSDIRTTIQTGFEEIMSEIVSMQEKLTQNTARIAELERAMKLGTVPLSSTPSAEVGDVLGLPLDSIQTLQEFEVRLLEETFQKSFHLEMQLLRGGKPSEFIRRMLSSIFTNKLAIMCSWTGIRGSFEVKSTKIVLNIERVTRTIHPNISKKEVKDTVALWLSVMGISVSKGKI